MQYDHTIKAGNFGDVWKHAVLVSIASQIESPNGFRYLESHSGAPVHLLTEKGEWREGIGSVLEGLGLMGQPYLMEASSWVKTSRYPAGWVFFARTLASRVSTLLIELCDLSVEVSNHYDSLPPNLCPDGAKVQFHLCDGYERALNSRANLVFLDPPFFPDPAVDWNTLAATCASLNDRGIPHMAWYPLNEYAQPDNLFRSAQGLAWEVAVADDGFNTSAGLEGCGVYVCDSLAQTLEAGRAELSELASVLTGGKGINERFSRSG